MNIDLLKDELKRNEGVRRFVYKDTVGKHTIACGRNLDDVGVSDDEIDYLLTNDINRVIADLDQRLPWWRGLSEARQLVLANMCFNLGIGRLMGFKNTLAAIKVSDYSAAADGMLASKWAGQVGKRAHRLAKMMREG
jgi:lysozyme